ncbi:MAG: lipopolysaccharide kinase InaA family protein [Candidatus Polarisedimenticolia bacterium]
MAPERDPLGAAVPSGYRLIRSPAGTWVGLTGCAAALGRGEADPLLLAPRRLVAPGGGRGGIAFLRLDGIEAAGKAPRHGGLIGPLLGRIYLGAGRILRQVDVAAELRRRGVPTPEVVAVGWRRVAGPLAVHAVLTRAVPGAVTLLDAAHRERGAPRRSILAACARLVRSLHDAGFAHADLNLTNILIESRAGGDRLSIIDLDGGRFVAAGTPGGLGESRRLRSLARLLRSCDRWMDAAVRPTGREEIAFLRVYTGSDRTRVRRYLARLRRGRAWHHARRRMATLLGLPRSSATRRQ